MKKSVLIITILVMVSIAVSAEQPCQGATCSDDEIKAMNPVQLQQIPPESLTTDQATLRWNALSAQQTAFFYKNNLNLFQNQFAEEQGLTFFSGCTTNCRFENGMLYNPPPETGFLPSAFKGFQVIANPAGGFRVQGVTNTQLNLNGNSYNLKSQELQIAANGDSVNLPSGADINFNERSLTALSPSGLNVPATGLPNVAGNLGVSGNGIQNVVEGAADLLPAADFSALPNGGANLGNVQIPGNTQVSVKDSSIVTKTTQSIETGRVTAETKVPLGNPADYKATLNLHQTIGPGTLDTSATITGDNLKLSTEYQRDFGSGTNKGSLSVEANVQQQTASPAMSAGIQLTYRPGN